jgi:hypothetical protein
MVTPDRKARAALRSFRAASLFLLFLHPRLELLAEDIQQWADQVAFSLIAPGVELDQQNARVALKACSDRVHERRLPRAPIPEDSDGEPRSAAPNDGRQRFGVEVEPESWFGRRRIEQDPKLGVWSHSEPPQPCTPRLW